MSNEVNIKSTTIEKGLELAKEFLGKLISPTVEELGLLISDNVKFLRFKNQVRILLKARDYVEKKKINVKEIPIKILVPLLDKASLDDNEELQDKWASMLTNMVDSSQNLQNQIFPYILSQISIQEYNGLASFRANEVAHRENITRYAELIKTDQFALSKEARQLRQEIDEIEQSGFYIGLEEFEESNLFRLGLIRPMPPKIYIQEFETGGQYEGRQWHQLKAEYNDAHDFGYRITELGERFLKICEIHESGDTTT